MSCDTSLTKFVPPHKIENGYMTSWLKLGECLKTRANQSSNAKNSGGTQQRTSYVYINIKYKVVEIS